MIRAATIEDMEARAEAAEAERDALRQALDVSLDLLRNVTPARGDSWYEDIREYLAMWDEDEE